MSYATDYLAIICSYSVHSRKIVKLCDYWEFINFKLIAFELWKYGIWKSQLLFYYYLGTLAKLSMTLKNDFGVFKYWH